MNKKNNRKGFTTVELVIVIAVIAILATVLIPTFSNLIGKAEESAALQEASSVFKSYTIENATTFSDKTIYVVADGYVFKVENGQLSNKPVAAGTEADPVEYPCTAVIIETSSDAADNGFKVAAMPAGFAVEHDDASYNDANKNCDNCK